MKLLFIILYFSILMPSISGYDIMKQINQKDKPKDLKSTLTMDSEKEDGKKRTSVFKSWVKNSGEKQLIWFIEPHEYKGIAFLKIEKDNDTDMRMWLPRYKKIRKISTANKNDSFMNSDLTFEDLYIRQIDDYSYTIIKEEIYNDKLCYIVLSSIKNQQNSAYSKHETWISKDELLPMKEISYDRDGLKEKQKEFTYIKKDKKDIISSIKIKNLKKEHYTNLYINDIILDSGIDDNYFKEHRLKRIPN